MRKKIQVAAPQAEVFISTLTHKYHWGRAGTKSRAEFKTFGGAVRAATRKGYEVITTVDPMIEFRANANKTKIVTVLGTDKLARIAVNSPLCCDPSSETYWSM